MKFYYRDLFNTVFPNLFDHQKSFFPYGIFNYILGNTIGFGNRIGNHNFNGRNSEIVKTDFLFLRSLVIFTCLHLVHTLNMRNPDH